MKKKIYISSDIKKIEIERKLEQCITIVQFSLDKEMVNYKVDRPPVIKCV